MLTENGKPSDRAEEVDEVVCTRSSRVVTRVRLWVRVRVGVRVKG